MYTPPSKQAFKQASKRGSKQVSKQATNQLHDLKEKEDKRRQKKIAKDTCYLG